VVAGEATVWLWEPAVSWPGAGGPCGA
jgi:hypothetical protein